MSITQITRLTNGALSEFGGSLVAIGDAGPNVSHITNQLPIPVV